MENIRLEIEVREADGVGVLSLAGEIDIYTAQKFKQAVDELIASGARHIVVDLAQVAYMDSSGFGVLLSAAKRLRPKGGSVNVAACGKSISRTLDLTRLDSVFGVFDTVDAAVQAVA